MRIYVADKSIIEKTLRRRRRERHYGPQVDLGAVLKEILERANEFVPSESGSIILDDPILKADSGEKGRLCFLACFGRGSESLVGTYLADDIGIIGETYRSGNPYLSRDVKKDEKFYSRIDEKTSFETRSVIAIPIGIDKSVIGVIELINRQGRTNYDKKDLTLLEIFAGYTSTLIQNSLDARRFEDLSKRDNLTGLFNDRYFYERLSQDVRRVTWGGGGDIILIFLDLDRFKEINDTHGHLAGSRVLKETAVIMEEIFSDSGASLARYGGDEYVILLPDNTIDSAERYAERLRQAIAQNIFLKSAGALDEPPLNIGGVITCSVGLASLALNVEPRENLKDMEEALIKAADGAMYRAKDLGKNRVVVAEGKR